MKSLVFAVSIWAASALATSVSWADGFDFKALKTLITTHNVVSMEQLLPLLPHSLRSNFTLMQESRSGQQASPLTPRAILFGTDAKLVLGFNGASSQNGYLNLDVMTFDDEAAEFRFKLITFDNVGPPVPVEHPDACVQCHGPSRNSLRPLWDLYPFWKGAYGGNDDGLSLQDPLLKAETTNYMSFRKAIQEDPKSRYRALIFNQSANPYEPFDNDAGSLAIHLDHRPNLLLNGLLDRLWAKHLAKVIRSAPGYAGDKQTILRGLNSCAGPYDFSFPEERLQDAYLKSFYGDSVFNPGAIQTPKKVFWIARLLGLDASEWVITPEVASYVIFDGLDNFDDLLNRELLTAENSMELAPFTQATGLVENPGLTEGSSAVAQILLRLGGAVTLGTSNEKICRVLGGLARDGG